MAEFPALGQNCAFSQCNELDFLPFQCPYCSKTFCSKHRSVTGHNCESWNEMQRQKQVEKIDHSSSYETYKCNFHSCSQKDPIPLLCRLCEKHFCLEHRHEYDHDCSKIENKQDSKPSKAAEFVQSLKKENAGSNSTHVSYEMNAVPVFVDLEKPAAKLKPTSKPEGLAAKVAYMKLKQSAIGDRQKIPEEERVYFYVELPEGYLHKNSNSMPIVFSKIWTIGKCIDLTASLANVPNKNNVAAAKKLRLFSNDNNEEIQLSLDETLEKLISDKLIYDTQILKLLYV